ncbi:putative acyltransferase [Bradyrhizobium sp. ORS 285]|uniref:acyltransferase family protein n=1 Tax=Bradyrhizobium sp. ORS 285 TaxID=115808 RepID=UPI0002408519|nr:acyltransferase family protein [Bradyrhizobium sp. ORS 285]CCD90339.1 putative acyltransferase [Bradyrhizobium sp. ORS 285]SMX57818.1 putative acyltransferase [Bradyrhizobium sp. ORS 285]
MEARYRADIDGLRAIAVCIVVLFHLKVAGFGGGFAGVDIFFVISGYLITGHILRDIELGVFSFAAFYARRARRILPALIVTIMLTFAAGWLWLPPDALRQLAKEATHGLLSIANIQYWRESNQYFAPSSDQLGLLHLWSLSAEEQFYLVTPLILVLLSRVRQVASGIALSGMVSLVAAIIWLRRDPEAVFFLTPFRVFEFALGALAIALERRFAAWPTIRTAATWSGYVVLFSSLLVIPRFQHDAGLGALPPSIATVAIIAANRPMRLFANRAVLAVGRSSYSLYLVHWPVIYFASFIFGEQASSTTGKIVQVLVMAALTVAMFVLVEQPIRRLQSAPWKQGVAFAAVIGLCVVATHAAFKADGVPWRLPEDQRARLELQRFGMSPCGRSGEDCAFGALAGSHGLELLGDSYVHQYVAALDDRLKARGIHGRTSTVGGCPMLIGMVPLPPRTAECITLRDRELARVKASPADLVVIGQAWHLYLEGPGQPDERRASEIRDGLQALLALLDRPGRRFLIIGGQVRPVTCSFDHMRMQPGPLWHAPPPRCAPFETARARADAREIDGLLDHALTGRGNAALLRPTELYCDKDCPVVRDDGVWLFLDPGHFTVAGARLMGQRADSVISQFLSEQSRP